MIYNLLKSIQTNSHYLFDMGKVIVLRAPPIGHHHIGYQDHYAI